MFTHTLPERAHRPRRRIDWGKAVVRALAVATLLLWGAAGWIGVAAYRVWWFQ